MVSRSEIDMLDVRGEFKKLFGYTLYSKLEVGNALRHARYCPLAFVGWGGLREVAETSHSLCDVTKGTDNCPLAPQPATGSNRASV